jgi:hypothetical protein
MFSERKPIGLADIVLLVADAASTADPVYH